MLLPLIIIIGTSFDASGEIVFPPEGLTLEWYLEFLRTPAWIQASKNSLITATGTMALSTALGTLTAFGVRRLSVGRTKWFTPLVLLPLLIPPVVTGVALLSFLGQIGLHQTYFGIIIAHSLWATPIVFFVMQAVLSRFDWEIHEAAMDLGAGNLQSFREVIFPLIKNGLLASALIAFVVSLQEFIMALFISGFDTRTIPVIAWSQLRQTLDPLVSVISTLLIVATLIAFIPIVLSIGLERFSRNL
jgi:ABC-type spermidine/putrescine transport system permease subunit II